MTRPSLSLRQGAIFGWPTFLGAALLFVVQPMLGKWLLPAAGGSAATWTACMLFVQTLLLAGYAYAHWLTGRLSLRHQLALHALLIVAAGTLLSILPTDRSAVLRAGEPVLAIAGLLFRTVGLPYLVLASSAPLLQAWAARAFQAEAPWLYAVSNTGSVVGLLAHPFLLEPWLSLDVERSAWKGAFWVFAASSILTLARLWRGNPTAVPAGNAEPGPRPTGAQRLRWLVLAFVPSVMLLGATQHLTVDIAPMPLLWVVPLLLYLLSFVVAFSAWRSAWRGPAVIAWVIGAVALGANAFAQAAFSLSTQLVGTLVALFSSCLLCHGELASARPDPRWLTGYYLVIALGGALGGVFVSLGAPLAFTDYYELELGAVLVFAVLLVQAQRPGAERWPRFAQRALLLGSAIAVPLLAASVLVRALPPKRQGVVVARSRSFLGTLRVVDTAKGRVLTHGRIQHGLQLAEPGLGRTPTLYFGVGTGIARVMEAGPSARARRLAVLGLGIGTLATYGRPGDAFAFFELDPRVVELARRDFTFLADSAAAVTTTLGDGRLVLDRAPPQAFDVLVLDAFSSDSVPVHLLTREAFGIYLRHLAAEGVLVANTSNRFLSLDRVVRASARASGLACVVVKTNTDPAHHVVRAEWALMARDPRALTSLTEGLPLSGASGPDVLWTDDHASVVPIMR
ncbi:MAG: fused MFS/spermidine synthase [Polyangiaceae bacterium]|nr:fused MFS/spermidine synthase [Polyangiaceae bacterium]